MFWLYPALIAGCVLGAALLLQVQTRLTWMAAALLSLGPCLGYVLSRTTGLPGATGDIGNWIEPLGLASLYVEACVLALSLYGLTTLRRLGAGWSAWDALVNGPCRTLSLYTRTGWSRALRARAPAHDATLALAIRYTSQAAAPVQDGGCPTQGLSNARAAFDRRLRCGEDHDRVTWERTSTAMAETTLQVSPAATVSLREITRATVWAICDLKTTPEQERFCGPNVDSLIEALFEPRAWFRAIYAGETPVGFLMLSRDSNAHGPLDVPTGEHYLWRLMIAAAHQRHGYGQRALQQLIAHVRTLPGATTLLTSCGPGEGSPGPFYRALGFVETGEVVDDEVVLRLPLDEDSRRPISSHP